MSIPYEHDPDMVGKHLGPLTVEHMNTTVASTGLAYPISGDALANWDGHGTERALERRIRRAAEPAIKYVMDNIMPNFQELQRQFEMIGNDDKMMARIRNGHPATPRKQLLHNGRKP